MDNKDIEKLIKHVFGSDEGKRLLDHLYDRNVLISIANTESLLEIGKRQGRADLIMMIKHILENK
jgi:hypothetical protein